MWGGRIKISIPADEGSCPFQIQTTESTMQRTALAIFGALLFSGSMVQMAAASEHHHVTKANVTRHHTADFRRAYDVVRPINVGATRLAPDRFDPSTPRSEDPTLNPDGS